MNDLTKKIMTWGLAGLMFIEASASAVGFGIERETEKYYDKRERTGISQQTADYRMRLGNMIGYSGLASLLFTGIGYSFIETKGEEDK